MIEEPQKIIKCPSCGGDEMKSSMLHGTQGFAVICECGHEFIVNIGADTEGPILIPKYMVNALP